MLTTLTPQRLSTSVLAVPPLCRRPDYTLNPDENAKLIRHIESGGITTLLYGGNANFYHLPPAEYDQTLSMLEQLAGAETLVIPSAGPAFGTMMDQAKTLRRHKFPTAMVLPQVGITTSKGVEQGIRRFVDAAGIPALLYIKNDGYIDPEEAGHLAKDKLISGIKYATVRPDPANDAYLRRLTTLIDPAIIISGIGEQPAITHLHDFNLAGFTSGCVCIAPKLSVQMLSALRAGQRSEADRLRQIFKPLEDLRNTLNPIRVLHEAVRLANIANTGPLLPLLSNLEETHWKEVADAATALRSANA